MYCARSGDSKQFTKQKYVQEIIRFNLNNIVHSTLNIYTTTWYPSQPVVASVRGTASRAFFSSSAAAQQDKAWNKNSKFASLAAATLAVSSAAAVALCDAQSSQQEHADPKTTAESYFHATSPEDFLKQSPPTLTAEEERLEEAALKAKKHGGGLKLFSGNGNLALSLEIARTLGINLGKATVGKFADGETNVQIHENVRGKDVYVVQPTCPPVNNNLMELLLMVSTLNRASARRITVVIPYYGYARQDRKMQVSWDKMERPRDGDSHRDLIREGVNAPIEVTLGPT